MKRVADSIWLIESIFPESLAQKIVERIDRDSVTDYMSLEDQPDLSSDFESFWKGTMDPIVFDYFYETEGERSRLYNHTEEERIHFRENLEFEWKNVYALNYRKENTVELPKFVHSDFCNFTFSCGLLSTTSFEGGELFFPKQNYSSKIERLDLLLFPGGITHPHYTGSVTSGRRINLIGQSKHFAWSKTRYKN